MQNLKSTNYKAGLYIRVSTEEQAENPEGSIRNQEDRLRDAVKYRSRNGNYGEIVDIYTDKGLSGKDTNRPELQRLLRAIRSREINLVMVTELSRLSRNNRDFIAIWDLMNETGCRFLSLREDFDTTTAAGEMLLFQLINFAQFERKQTSERVAANIAARSARGLFNGGAVPMGYKLIPGKPGFLEVDPDGAELVKKIFDAFLKQGSLSKAALWLNDNGYSLKKHIEGLGARARLGHFTVDNVQNIISNKIYLGIKVLKNCTEKKEVKAVWPSIIDELTFNRAQVVLKENKSRYKPENYKAENFNRYHYLLTGVTHCATCGDHMPGKSGNGRNGKHGYYEHSWATKRDSTLSSKIFKCSPHRVPAKKAEPLVWDQIMKLLTNKAVMKCFIDDAKILQEERPDLREKERLKAKIYGINSQTEALAERIAALPKSFPAKTLFDQLEKLDAKKKEVEAQLSELRRLGHTDWDGEVVDLSSFERFSSMVTEAIVDASVETKKAILRALIGKIEIAPDKVKIGFFADKQHYSTIIQEGFIKPLGDFSKTSDSDLDLISSSKSSGKSENCVSSGHNSWKKSNVAPGLRGSHSLTCGALGRN